MSGFSNFLRGAAVPRVFTISRASCLPETFKRASGRFAVGRACPVWCRSSDRRYRVREASGLFIGRLHARAFLNVPAPPRPGHKRATRPLVFLNTPKVTCGVRAAISHGAPTLASVTGCALGVAEGSHWHECAEARRSSPFRPPLAREASCDVPRTLVEGRAALSSAGFAVIRDFQLPSGTNSVILQRARTLARACAGFFYSWMAVCVSLHAAIVFFCLAPVIQCGSVNY
jgi:hypothetical protein